VKNIYQNGGESQLALKLRQRHPVYNLAYGSLMMQPHAWMYLCCTAYLFLFCLSLADKKKLLRNTVSDICPSKDCFALYDFTCFLLRRAVYIDYLYL